MKSERCYECGWYFLPQETAFEAFGEYLCAPCLMKKKMDLLKERIQHGKPGRWCPEGNSSLIFAKSLYLRYQAQVCHLLGMKNMLCKYCKHGIDIMGYCTYCGVRARDWMKIPWVDESNRIIRYFDKKKQRRIHCENCNTLQNWKRWGEMKFCNKCGSRIDWYDTYG